MKIPLKKMVCRWKAGCIPQFEDSSNILNVTRGGMLIFLVSQQDIKVTSHSFYNLCNK